MEPRLLLVLTPPKRSCLMPLLDGQGFQIECATGYQDAVRKLSDGHTVDLILADAELPDGSWRNLILFAQNSGLRSEMIICAKAGESELWAEVIQCGAYDMIAEPFERQEVIRIIRSTLDSQYMRRFTQASSQ